MKKSQNPNSQYLLENISIGASNKGITHIIFNKNKGQKPQNRTSPEIKKAYREIKEYLDGRRKKFSLRLDFSGLTDFHKEVYKQAITIPYGETRTYQWIAKQIGRNRACRAVGSAMAKNPFLLVMPCHRVLMTDGGLGGFGIGLEWKTFLLNLEQKNKKNNRNG